MKRLSISFITTLIIQLVTIFGGILSARLLLPQGKGELTAILLWPSLLAILGNLGLFDALSFFSASKSKSLSKIVSSGVILVGLLSILLVGIGYFSLPLL